MLYINNIKRTASHLIGFDIDLGLSLNSITYTLRLYYYNHFIKIITQCLCKRLWPDYRINVDNLRVV